jgi:hypothetical protein
MLHLQKNFPAYKEYDHLCQHCGYTRSARAVTGQTDLCWLLTMECLNCSHVHYCYVPKRHPEKITYTPLDPYHRTQPPGKTPLQKISQDHIKQAHPSRQADNTKQDQPESIE